VQDVSSVVTNWNKKFKTPGFTVLAEAPLQNGLYQEQLLDWWFVSPTPFTKLVLVL
jgi:hypothetical protein